MASQRFSDAPPPASPRPPQVSDSDWTTNRSCQFRSAEAIIVDLKHTLDILLGIPARERGHHFKGFQALCLELERGRGVFPPELKTKIDSLQWFCERMCHPEFVPSDGQMSFLAWPHTLLDAIKARLQGEDPASAN
jgi:hypothetical protein